MRTVLFTKDECEYLCLTYSEIIEQFDINVKMYAEQYEFMLEHEGEELVDFLLLYLDEFIKLYKYSYQTHFSDYEFATDFKTFIILQILYNEKLTNEFIIKHIELIISNMNKNIISYLKARRMPVIEYLIDTDKIDFRKQAYILFYLPDEYQTVSMCQDAIDSNPDNLKYVCERLKRYFR